MFKIHKGRRRYKTNTKLLIAGVFAKPVGVSALLTWAITMEAPVLTRGLFSVVAVPAAEVLS
jgi:ABC-type cobalamin transport system permease subunit